MSLDSGADLVLRPYRPCDLATLHEIDVECFERRFRFSLADLKHFIEDRRAHTVIAQRAGATVGFLVVHLHRSRVQTYGYVVTVDVREGARRLGIGHRLLLEGERLAREQDATSVRLHVFSGNDGAQRFYRESGYLNVGEAPGFYGESLDAILMEKRLMEKRFV